MHIFSFGWSLFEYSVFLFLFTFSLPAADWVLLSSKSLLYLTPSETAFAGWNCEESSSSRLGLETWWPWKTIFYSPTTSPWIGIHTPLRLEISMSNSCLRVAAAASLLRLYSFFFGLCMQTLAWTLLCLLVIAVESPVSSQASTGYLQDAVAKWKDPSKQRRLAFLPVHDPSPTTMTTTNKAKELQDLLQLVLLEFWCLL